MQDLLGMEIDMSNEKKLKEALLLLRLLATSADRYIEDGSWLEALNNDIYNAKEFLINNKENIYYA
jgi:hypothetical protein